MCRDLMSDDWLYVIKSGSSWVLRRLHGYYPPCDTSRSVSYTTNIREAPVFRLTIYHVQYWSVVYVFADICSFVCSFVRSLDTN